MATVLANGSGIPMDADVGVDRPVEGHFLRQGVDEHQGIVHVSADDGLFPACLGEPHATFGGGAQLAGEN